MSDVAQTVGMSHETELSLHRIRELASLMERGQLTQPRKVGRELRLLADGIAAQPPAAPVETPLSIVEDIEWIEKLAIEDRANSAIEACRAIKRKYAALQRSSAAATVEKPKGCEPCSYPECGCWGSDSLKRLAVRLADLLDADHWNNIEPLLLNIEEGLKRASSSNNAVVGPNVHTADFEDNSGSDPGWHKVQDEIDAWAEATLGADAVVIMSWSDRIAQHLTPSLPRSSAAPDWKQDQADTSVLPRKAAPVETGNDLTVDSFLAIWSMKPPSWTEEGKAWEAGARQGWRWAEQEHTAQKLREGTEFAGTPLDRCSAGNAELTDIDRGTVARRLRQLVSRVEYRVEVMEERDGKDGAIIGPGIGIGYLFARDLAKVMADAAAYIEGLSVVEPQKTGCGTPGCADPNCDYGKGPLRCQSCGAVVVGEPQTLSQWQPIETAPREPEAMFMVCAVGDARGPFVVRSDILWRAREAGTPSHLGLSYLTHWMPLPEMPR